MRKTVSAAPISPGIDYLATINSHPRDDMISFEEGPHIYTINGDSSFTSVTTWNHSHFEKFNADKIIENMMKSKKWHQSKYFGMTPDEIKNQWNQNGKEASEAGTAMHYDIECYYNDMNVNNDSVEYSYFNNFLKVFEKENETRGNNPLTPYRTEWMVFHEELKFAGSIDMTFANKDGTIQIYDWKRCKDISKSNAWGKFSTNPIIEHLPDTNYWHYCLQLNTYKAIIEAKYGKTVSDMYLVCLHPDNKRQNFERIKVVDLQDEVAELFEERKQELAAAVEAAAEAE